MLIIYQIMYSYSLTTSSLPPYSKNSPAQTESKSSEGWIGYLGSALASGTAYLPSGVTEIFSQGRDHALARIPSLAGLRSVVALATLVTWRHLLATTTAAPRVPLLVVKTCFYRAKMVKTGKNLVLIKYNTFKKNVIFKFKVILIHLYINVMAI